MPLQDIFFTLHLNVAIPRFRIRRVNTQEYGMIWILGNRTRRRIQGGEKFLVVFDVLICVERYQYLPRIFFSQYIRRITYGCSRIFFIGSKSNCSSCISGSCCRFFSRCWMFADIKIASSENFSRARLYVSCNKVRSPKMAWCCLGLFFRESGHSRVPDPPASMSASIPYSYLFLYYHVSR